MPIESTFINPFTDYGFKRLFGAEKNTPLLIDFLNQFLPERHQIADLHYAQNEQLGANEMDRKAVLMYIVSARLATDLLLNCKRLGRRILRIEVFFTRPFQSSIREWLVTGILNYRPCIWWQS